MKTTGLSRGEILVGMEQGVFKEGDKFKDVSEQGVGGVIVIISDEENETAMVWARDEMAFVQLRNCLTEKWDLIAEPEFKVGDWIFWKSTYGNLSQTAIVQGFDEDGDLVLDEGSEVYKNECRHATEEEIQKEKQFRFWYKLGREVNEYRTGDIIFDRVTSAYSEIDLIVDDIIITTHNSIGSDGLCSIRLICPAEQRVDI